MTILMIRSFCLVVTLCVCLSACTERAPAQLPTIAAPEAAATSIILTRNAPPAGYDSVSFPQIDANLQRLSGWRYEMTLSFEGVFARTPRDVSVQTELAASYSQLNSARRIEVDLDLEDLSASAGSRAYEAVRLVEDVYVVEDGFCFAGEDEATARAADLRASDLVGGVANATTAAQKAVINGEDVWRYDFGVDDLVLPALDLGETGRITSVRGDFWVAPQHDAVVRYYADVRVENVTLFGSSLPVSGTLLIRYDLYEVGVVPNLSVPFGC